MFLSQMYCKPNATANRAVVVVDELAKATALCIGESCGVLAGDKDVVKLVMLLAARMLPRVVAFFLKEGRECDEIVEIEEGS
jgi:hypothetical protein